MKDAQPKAIYLKDYQVPEFLIDRTELHFDLHDEFTRVTADLALRRKTGKKPDSANS